MPWKEFYVLLPDPVHGGVATDSHERIAESLWNTWTLAWHPSILAECLSIPRILTPDMPTDLPSGSLILVAEPICAQNEHLLDELRGRGVNVVTVGESRVHPESTFRQLGIALTDIEHMTDVALDFYALGYAALQIIVLSRRLHFSSHCDSTVLQERCVSAAQLARQGSMDELREALHACFDALRDQRHQFYPVDIHLLDWTLCPPNLSTLTTGPEIPTTLKHNLWCTGRQIRQMEAGLLSLLQGAVSRGTYSPCGLEENELALPMWPADVAVDELRRGIALAEHYFGKRLRVFARRRFGLSGRLPLLLNNLGFDGAVHATLDAGQFPRAAQPRTQWFGFGGAAIDAVACVPLDRRNPSTLLNLAQHIGHSIDRHYVATICLAGWWGERYPWYDDLHRACQWSPVIGTLESWETYLLRTSPMGQHANFGAGEYRSPYLVESVLRNWDDPISRWVQAWAIGRGLDGAQALVTWSLLIDPESAPIASQRLSVITQQRDRIIRWTECIGNTLDESSARTGEVSTSEIEEAVRQIADGLLGPTLADNPDRGTLIVNPSMAPLRLALSGRRCESVSADDDVRIYPLGETVAELIVDVPAAGYRWIPFTAVTVVTHGAAEPWPLESRHTGVITREWELANEFVRVRIDPESGGLGGFYPRTEGPNRLSQRLYRVQDGVQLSTAASASTHDSPLEETDGGSRMVAEGLAIDQSSPAVAAIVSKGRVEQSDGTPCLQYRQRFELASGMRHVTLDVEIQLLTEIHGAPWSNYVASRVAWRSSDARFFSIVQEMIAPMSAERFDSPLGFKILNSEEQTWVQSMGLPYHRKIGDHQCDTLLVVQGERARSFRMRFCLDPARPLADAMGALDRPFCLPTNAPRQTSGWLAFVDSRQVICSAWQPILEDQAAAGFRVRLWESAGQQAKTTLRAARPIRSAQKCDFFGSARSICPVEHGTVQVTLSPFEWTDLECRW